MTYALVTCSGVSNTGKLTTQAAQILLQRKPGHYVWMHAKQSAATLEAEIGDAEQVIVIDGCTDCCATKKLTILPDMLQIATSSLLNSASRRMGWLKCSTMRSRKLSVPS